MNENNINLKELINNLLNGKLNVNQIISESLIQTLLSYSLNSLMTKERDLFINLKKSLLFSMRHCCADMKILDLR